MIRLLVLDVDGTLTDGKIYMSAQGEWVKAFNIKDGLAIARLSRGGVRPLILTGRSSDITAQRCAELGISDVHQGIDDKATRLCEIAADLSLDWTEIAYVGDDINDLPAMRLCAHRACPVDAAGPVLSAATYVSPLKGGEGAVRDCIEAWIHQGLIPAEVLQ
jgi:3-deoxy-D-manno-octulosonate 8-phosphate phosphatase (KDO 8-P phosphatase)